MSLYGRPIAHTSAAWPKLASLQLFVRERILTNEMVRAHLLAEWLPYNAIYLILKAAGYDIAGACGLRGARIETTHLQIAKPCWIREKLWIEGGGAVSIGSHSMIGPDVLIVTSHHKKDETGKFRPEPINLPVRIGEHCWIGARALLLPGVSVGDGVTVAAGAVVASDIGPGGVYGGVPARRLK